MEKGSQAIILESILLKCSLVLLLQGQKHISDWLIKRIMFNLWKLTNIIVVVNIFKTCYRYFLYYNATNLRCVLTEVIIMAWINPCDSGNGFLMLQNDISGVLGGVLREWMQFVFLWKLKSQDVAGHIGITCVIGMLMMVMGYLHSVVQIWGPYFRSSELRW